MDFEDLKEYKAVFKSSPKGDSFEKQKCIIPISVGQSIHEGKNFKALLKLVNTTFKECVIVVCDSLQRHSIAIYNNKLTDQELHEETLKLGCEWVDRNQKNIKQYLKIPYQIRMWDEFLRSSEYKIYYKKLDNIYNKNLSDFKDIVNLAAEDIINKWKKTKKIQDVDRSIRLSIRYLKEESVISCMWYKDGYKFIIYNGMNAAIGESIKLFESNLKFLSYRLKVIKYNEFSFQSIIDASPAHIYWKNTKGIYRGCNLGLTTWLKKEKISEILGKTDFDLIDFKFAKKVRAIDYAIMKTGKARIVKEIDEGGSVFLSYKSPLKDCDGEIIGIIGNSIEITKQDKAEKRIIHDRKELQIALNVKESFLNNISHELRTPLHVISSIADELNENIDQFSIEETKSFLRMLLDSKNRMMKLVNNLLSVLKGKQKKLKINIKAVNIAKTIFDIVSEMQFISKSKINFDITKLVDKKINCDKDQIEQVLRNLIDNAIRYGDDKDIEVNISDSESKIIISIIDKGIGIPDEEKEIIFKPFEEGSRTKTRAGGTGLGLAICLDIILLHKGSILVEDNVPKGSKFIIALPK